MDTQAATPSVFDRIVGEPMRPYQPSYWGRTDGQAQLSHQTKYNRFPKIFESARHLCPDAERVLSFGCSTGEEAQTLADLFPQAEVVGVDIDYNSVQVARRNNSKPNVHFHDCLGGTGKYDLCTCLMVLFALDSPIPLERANSIIADIAAHMNPGGVVMLYTCDHNPLKCEQLSSGFEVLKEWTRRHEKKPEARYFCGYYRKISKVKWS